MARRRTTNSRRTAISICGRLSSTTRCRGRFLLSLSHSFSFSLSFSLFFLLLPAIAKNRSLFFVLLPRSFSFASILREIPRQDRVRRNYPPSPVSAPIFLLFLALSFALFLSFLAAIEVSCRTGREKCPDSNSLFLARPRDRRQRENGS